MADIVNELPKRGFLARLRNRPTASADPAPGIIIKSVALREKENQRVVGLIDELDRLHQTPTANVSRGIPDFAFKKKEVIDELRVKGISQEEINEIMDRYL